MAPPNRKTTTLAPVNKRVEFVNRMANKEGFKTFGPKTEAVRKMFANAPSTYSLSESGREAYKNELNRDFSTKQMQDWLKGLYERSPNLVTRSFPAGNPKNDQGPSTSKRAKLHTDSTDISDDSSPSSTNSDSQHSAYSNIGRQLAREHNLSNIGSDSSSSSSSSNSSSSNNTAFRPIQNLVNDSGLGNDIEMGLPGTGQGTGGSGDGNASSAMEIYSPERPLTIFGKKESTYRKVHRFMTFGIAPTWLNVDKETPTEQQRWLTTALAKIPWELPVLYMNPSEFNLLPNGSYCKEVRISIVHRGNRIAFETAESATKLATLNQIQNILVGFGLNKTGWGTDITYTSFDAANPMKPTAFSAPTDTTYDERFYGYENANADFTTYIPTHQMGIPFPLPNYFALANAVENFGGVPPLTENVQFYDGKTTIDQHIASFKYNPKMGQLKLPLKHIRSGLPRNIASGDALNIPINGCITSTHNAKVSCNASDATGTDIAMSDEIVNPTNDTSTMSGLYTLMSNIEKSQFTKQGLWGQYERAQVQPSVHIGIQAIPSLTSTGILSPIANWTDAQADWDVICEMDVIEYNPTKLPYATSANIPAGDVIMHTSPSAIPNSNSCTYAGLYPLEAIR